MFTIQSILENGFEIVQLKDTSNNTIVEVIPACGGILHGFKIGKDGKLFNVIDNYESKEDFEKHVESKGFKSCKLSPFACRINDATYEFAGKKLYVDKFLLNNSALHGLLYNVEFKIVEQTANDQQAKIVLEHQYKATHKGYPFNYSCIISYTLKHNNELIITTKIINKDDKAIPMQDGWHPYFTLGKNIDELLLQFNSKEKILFNAAMIPTGEGVVYKEFNTLKKIGSTNFDDCFSLNPNSSIILKNEADNLQVEITPDKNYPYLQIYTPPDRKTIAIENLSAPPDTFNNGIDLIILQPNQEKTFITTYKIS